MDSEINRELIDLERLISKIVEAGSFDYRVILYSMASHKIQKIREKVASNEQYKDMINKTATAAIRLKEAEKTIEEITTMANDITRVLEEYRKIDAWRKT